MIDVVQAARAHLLTVPSFAALIGTDVGTDTTWDAWVTEGLDDSGLPPISFEGTGTSVLSINLREPWAAPNRHNSMRFRTVQVLIFSAPTTGQADARARCERVSDAVIDAFHDPANVVHWWGPTMTGLFVIDCVLGRDLIMVDVPSMAGPVRGELRFDLAY